MENLETLMQDINNTEDFKLIHGLEMMPANWDFFEDDRPNIEIDLGGDDCNVIVIHPPTKEDKNYYLALFQNGGCHRTDDCLQFITMSKVINKYIEIHKKEQNRPIFRTLSTSEILFKYKGHNFCLVEKNQGVYSMGKVVRLYKLDGFDKQLLTDMGWIKKDGGYDTYKKGGCFIDGLTDIETIKDSVTSYIDAFI